MCPDVPITTEIIETILKKEPGIKNQDLYVAFNATTTKDKDTVRRLKNRILNRKKGVPKRKKRKPSPTTPKKGLKLNEKTLESLIAQSLNTDPNPQMIRTAVDFLVKVKGIKTADIPDLDLSKFLEVTNASNNSTRSD